MAYLLHIGRVHEGCFWEPWNSERHKEDSNLQYLYVIVAYDGILRKLPSFICLQPTKLGKLFLQPVTVRSPQRYWVEFHRTSDYNQQRYSDGTDFRIGQTYRDLWRPFVQLSASRWRIVTWTNIWNQVLVNVLIILLAWKLQIPEIQQKWLPP